MQAAGSWSLDACCAVPGNDCYRGGCGGADCCTDRASSSDWLFGLWPGPPQRFEPTGTDTAYQAVRRNTWPIWGDGNVIDPDLAIGYRSGAPGGSGGDCRQGNTYRGTMGEICGDDNWGATDVEVWYFRDEKEYHQHG